LARNFKNHNPELDGEILTEVTQRTLDRLVFLRFLEDKLIEPKYYVSEFGEKGNAWREFIALCRRLDNIYNGIVFKKHDILDRPNLKVDEIQFADLCEELAHINSPYDFNSIPIHILGNIYERFLGKVIVVTDKRAKVEPKPEIRKAGGVYYTPEYIVRYIVDNAVRRLIAGKSPRQIALMRFADIACGSGSFLIAIYDLLLRYHRDWYNENADKAEKAGCAKRDDGYWHLSLKQKREILLNNIYGVDIDHQAVEVAQLSLYLKLLEEETTSSAHEYQLEFRETLLPSLADNIKQGNSLIASDFSVIPEDLVRVHAFDWPIQFSTIMKAGGFDAIVGNPPWGATFDEPQLAYFREKHHEIIVRMIDSYMYFVHKSVSLLRDGGAFGMILPDVLLYQTDSQKLRELLAKKMSLTFISNMGNVFERVTRPACIVMFIKKVIPNNSIFVADFSSVPKEEKPDLLAGISSYSKVRQTKLLKVPGCQFTTSGLANFLLWERVNRCPSNRLADIVDDDGIQRGVSPDLKEAFIVDQKTVKEWNLEREKLRPVLTGGKHIKRYDIDRPDLLLIYMQREDDYRRFPNICSFIGQFKKKITCREVKEKKHSYYSLHRAREERIFLKPQKLLGVITEDEIVIALDDQGAFATDGLYLFALKKGIDPRYVMGILNSKLFVVIYRLLSLEEGRVLAQVKPTVLANLPIRTLDLGNHVEKSEYDGMISLVEKIISLKPCLRTAQTDSERAALQNALSATDRQIDELAYKLYGLSEKEIKIVEDATERYRQH
jgi:type I restriction-modification system DNA methylase subunit